MKDFLKTPGRLDENLKMNKMAEKKEVEKELSFLYERTLIMEDELNLFIQMEGD
nr:hypothetical protein [uncultured archaeon]AQS34682.1 hypothetical protein [uncultured archaeon]